MHADILSNYLDKEVEISTVYKQNYSGILRMHDSVKNVVILAPIPDRYSRYGDTVVRQDDIVSLREVLPRIEDDDTDMKEAYDGDSDSYSYADAKRTKMLKTAKKMLDELKSLKQVETVPALSEHDHGTG